MSRDKVSLRYRTGARESAAVLVLDCVLRKLVTVWMHTCSSALMAVMMQIELHGVRRRLLPLVLRVAASLRVPIRQVRFQAGNRGYLQ
mmetsp:Transcript_80547/g.133247  ORF Transcript_80547/g.133247 Transcript_80547/m.133247 type:complete len:88 (-) Transcript_80547:488-751(-)